MTLAKYYKKAIYDYGYSKGKVVGSTFYENDIDKFIVADYMSSNDLTFEDMAFVKALGLNIEDFTKEY